MKKIGYLLGLLILAAAACHLLPQPWRIESLEFLPEELSLKAGEQKKVEVTAEPEQVLQHVCLSYTVADPEIAEVIPSRSDFLVSALRAGKTIITIEGTDGLEFHFPLTVAAESEKLKLSAQYLSLKRGDQKSLHVTGNTGSELYWSVTPPDQEIVRLLGSGESVLVIAEDCGEVVVRVSNDLGQMTVCEVLVEEEEKLQFFPPILELDWEDGTATSLLEISPRDQELTFHMEDERIASYEYNPETNIVTVTPLAEGSTVLSVTGEELSAYLQIKVNVDYELDILSDLLILEPGQAGTFFYYLNSPGTEVEWSLSDPSIAAITENPDSSITVLPAGEGECQVTGCLKGKNLKDSITLTSWYSSLEVEMKHKVTRPCDESDDNKRAGFHGGNFWVIDNVQNQLSLVFPQTGVKINSITWTKSADFDQYIQYQVFEDGKRLVFEFHPPFTLLNEDDPGGSLSVQINYSNQKLWSKTVPIMVFRRNG